MYLSEECAYLVKCTSVKNVQSRQLLVQVVEEKLVHHF